MRLVLLALVLSLVSCKQAPPKNRAAAEAKVAAIEAAGKTLLPAATDKITYAGPALSPADSGGNCVMLSVEALRSLKSAYDAPALFRPPPKLQTPLAWLSGAPIPKEYKTADVEDELAKIERIAYVLVIKTVEWKRPVAGKGKFVPGSYRGEAHLVDLAGKHYGGVRFAGESSEKVTVAVTTDGTSGKEIYRNDEGVLEGDVRDKAWEDLSAKLTKELPGSRFDLR